ncbi:MAG: hypothetical protein HOO91_04775 [Bacteroidales bacterium]|nr:hypothetical protein [Bacteroidales bacterium]
MKISIIDVQKKGENESLNTWFDFKKNRFFCPSLSAPILASKLSDYELEFIDQKVDRKDVLCDLALISFKTNAIYEAKQLACQLQDRGIDVLVGGMHVSLEYKDFLHLSSSIFIGEAEDTITQWHNDWLNKTAKKTYKAAKLVDLKAQCIPRFDILDSSKYAFHSIQTSRGCSIGCDFCPTKIFFGGVFRTKTITQVIDEIECVLRIEKKPILFTDDIFGAGDRDFIKTLLSIFKTMNFPYMIISDFEVLDNVLIDEFAASGCIAICLNMPGTCTNKEKSMVNYIQSVGIDIWGYFMFGFEEQDKTVFNRVIDFVNETEMKATSLTVLSPFPNTPLSLKLNKEDRIVMDNYSLYDQTHAVHIPAKMKYTDLLDGYNFVKVELNKRNGFHNYSQELYKKLNEKWNIRM